MDTTLESTIIENDKAMEVLLYLYICISIIVSLTLGKAVLSLIMVIPAFLVVAVCIRGDSYRIPRICVNLIVFQNFIIGIIAHWINYSLDDLSYVTQIPFLFVAVVATYRFITERISKGLFSFRFEDYMFAILVIMLLIQLIVSRGSFSSKIYGIRNYTVFYMAYIVGSNCIKSKEELIRFIRYMIRICLFTVVAGLVLSLADVKIWETIGIREIYLAKHDYIAENSLPGRFTTYFMNYSVNRMASLYYEPVNLAYLLSLGSLLSIFSDWTNNIVKKVLASALLSIGLLLTFGKGGLMVTLMASVLFLFLKFLNSLGSKENKIACIAMVVAVVLLLFFGGKYYIEKYNAWSNPHVAAIISTWKNIVNNPFGYGLGTGGNANLMLGQSSNTTGLAYSEWLASGGETALLAFCYQMGTQAFLPFFLCFSGMAMQVAKVKKTQLYRMVMLLPFIVLGISIYQENTYTPQCIIPFMLVIGGYASKEPINGA